MFCYIYKYNEIKTFFENNINLQAKATGRGKQ